MSFATVSRFAIVLGALPFAASAIEVYTGTTITPEAAKAIPSAPSANPVTSPRTTALRRREIDHVTSKPLDVVYSATIDAATNQPVTVIYATRLDPTTGRPVDVFSMNERKSAEWVASTQLDPQTGAPVGTVYARRFDVRTGRPMDIVRTVPLRGAASKSRMSSMEPERRTLPPTVTGSQTPAAPIKREPPSSAKKTEPVKPSTASAAAKPPADAAAAKPKPAPTREALAGTWWCVAPSWSSGVIEIAADGTYTRPGGVKGTYRVQGTDVIFDGGLKAWDNGRARFEGGNLIFEWTNPDGGQNYFAFRKG